MQETMKDNKTPVIDLSGQLESDPEDLKGRLSNHGSLRAVLAWAKGRPSEAVHPHVVAEIITQDEFTHDIIVPYCGLFLVYDTT